MHGVSFAAKQLLERVRQLLPTEYQRDSLDALMGLFLQATGASLPQHSRLKSPRALSRFLNRPVRAVGHRLSRPWLLGGSRERSSLSPNSGRRTRPPTRSARMG